MQRFYAFVQTRSGDLGEQLVENGLARIHSGTARAEGLNSAGAEWQKLVSLEHKARAEKIGGWGVDDGRMEVRAQQPESGKGIDPFDKFFHPAELTEATDLPPSSPSVAEDKSAADEPTPPPRTLALTEAKLDVNTASEAELENVNGIGPVIAERIIAARPFKNADDLRAVKGIGDVKFARIRPYFD